MGKKTPSQMNDEELIQRGREVGVPWINKYFKKDGEPDVDQLRRIPTMPEKLRELIVNIEQERSARRAVIAATVSAIGAVISAAAAWYVIYSRQPELPAPKAPPAISEQKSH